MMIDLEQSKGERRLELIGLGVILVLALVLRLRHLDELLFWFNHEDELQTTKLSLELIKNRTLNPANTLYPALVFYINALAYLFWAAPGLWGNIFEQGPKVLLDFISGFKMDDPLIILLSRWVSVAFGLGSIVFTHLLAKLYLRWRWALFCTLLVAVNTLHVGMSGLAKVDAINAFWFAAGFYTAVIYYRQGGMRRLMLAAACAALAMTVKNNFILCLLLGLVIVLRVLREGKGLRGLLTSREMWAGGLAMLAVAFIASPYLFINFQQTLIKIGWMAKLTTIFSFYHTDPHAWWRDRYFYNISVVLPFVWGLPVFWALVPAIVHHARKHAMTDPYVLLALTWSVYLMASMFGDATGAAVPYYMFLHVVPLVMLIVAEWLQDLSFSGSGMKKALATCLFFIIMAGSIMRVDAFWDYYFDGHDKVGRWMAKNLAADKKTLMVYVHTPTPALGISSVRAIWPQVLDEQLLADYDPDVIVIDTLTIGGFRKIYRHLWVAPLVDSLTGGQRGYKVRKRFEVDYFNRAYYAALDPDHDVEIVVLERDRKD